MYIGQVIKTFKVSVSTKVLTAEGLLDQKGFQLLPMNVLLNFCLFCCDKSCWIAFCLVNFLVIIGI